MPELATTFIFVGVGLLFIGLARPFIRRSVPPNYLSGLRVRATLTHPAVWYEANAATGRDLARLGVAVLVGAVVVPWVVGRDAALVLAAGVVAGAVALGVVGRARANRLLAEHAAAGEKPGENDPGDQPDPRGG